MNECKRFVEVIDEFILSEQVEDGFLTSVELKKRVEEWVLHLLRNGTPPLVFVRRDNTNISDSIDGKRCVGSALTHRQYHPHKAIYVRTWIVLGKVYGLLSRGQVMTLRGLYYSLVTYFRNQKQLDKIVSDLAAMLHVSRAALGIIGETRGKIGGMITFQSSSGEVIPLKQLNGVRLAELDPQSIHRSIKPPQLILVVEKDAIFQKLIQEKICDRIPMVLMTGAGYPDMITRNFVHHLTKTWGIPAVGLFDFNPDGLRIFLSYRCGSVVHGMENQTIAVPMRLLGISATDVRDQWQFQPLTSRQKGMIEKLKQIPLVRSSKSLTDHVDAMQRYGSAEIEAIQYEPKPIEILGGEMHQVKIPQTHALVDLISRKILRRSFIY